MEPHINDLKHVADAISKHKWTFAEQELQRKAKAEPKRLDVLMLMQELYWAKGDHRKAKRFVKKAYKLYPHNPIVVWNYGSCLFNENNFRGAIGVFTKILAKSNQALAANCQIKSTMRAEGFKLDVRVILGECYMHMEEYTSAIPLFKQYLNKAKSQVPSIYTKRTVNHYLRFCLLSHLYNSKEYNSENYRIAQEAYLLAPNDPMVIWSFAGWENNLFKYQRAIDLYKKLLRKNIKTLVRHCDIQTRDVARGLKLDTGVRIAECYMNAGQFHNAIQYLTKYLREKDAGIPTEYSKTVVKRYLKECESHLSN